MAGRTVNLDAMILRDDMAVLDAPAKPTAQSRTAMSILDLDGGFFTGGLKKPDFQRETTHWVPQKVVDLISAFVRGDLIPAVILWQRGADSFVIDGAHRLSALLAWIQDDYGDRARSLEFFGAQVPPEQLEVADKTRKLVNKHVGPYSLFKGLTASGSDVSENHRAVLEGLRNSALVVQWVPTSDRKSAENSFFKINQAAQPIDPTERRILLSRSAANAVTARCIVRGGKGHKYWAMFSEETVAEIESLGAEIFDALFRPIIEEPISTLDLPVAGRGYNQLPFAFDLTNWCNGVPLPDREDSAKVGGMAEIDKDGSRTIEYLKEVRKVIRLITTKDPGSFGFHPAVYFYAMSGSFMPNAFLATAQFAQRLVADGKRNSFTRVRRSFEDYLFEKKVYISLTVTKLGSGSRSMGRLSDMFWTIFECFEKGRTPEEVTEQLLADPKFSHLAMATVPPSRTERGKTGRMSGATKSAVGIRAGYASVSRCAICGSALHFRSTSVDHIQRRSAGGAADMTNGQMTHPYCNTGYKG